MTTNVYVLKLMTVFGRRPPRNFFAVRKDADRNVPILKEAKAEYAKLQ